MNYRSRPLFDFAIDWSALPSSRVEYDLREVSLGFNATAFYGDQEYVIHGWRFQVALDDADAIEAFDAFTAALGGRLSGFWLPTPVAAFEIVDGVSYVQFNISGSRLSGTLDDHPSRRFVWFTKDGQTPQAARISTVSANEDGTERVTCEESVSVDETWQAWGLAYVRLADDIEEGEFVAEGKMVRKVQVVELPAEYLELETVGRPVWFYRIWIGEGDAEVNWYWTSFACDLADVGGHSYATQRVTHGAVSFDTTGARQGITLEVDREIEGSPFQTAFPPYGCQPLKIEVASAQYPELDSLTVLFRGVVSSVAVSGRVLQVKCEPLAGASQTTVPSLLYGPRCPYRLFDTETCGATRASFEHAVALDLIDGREVTVIGAGLVGLAANWFAEGWLEVGTGIDREIRLVLTSTAATANAVTLTLNAPLRLNTTGDTALLLPGCDGRMSTCAAKYDNAANFGGHRWAMKNLALKAIDVKTPAAAKK